MNEFKVITNNNKSDIQIIDEKSLTLNGHKFSYDFYQLNNDTYILRLNNKFYEVVIKKNENNYYNVLINNSIFDTIVRNKLQDDAAKIIEQKNTGSQNHDIKAPMPGMVVMIKKNMGDKVAKNESIIILEAMKMENDIRSPIAGRIKNFYIQEGKAVEKGALLFTIE